MVAEVEVSAELSVQEAAYLAGVSERSVRNWMQDGKLPYTLSEQGKRVNRADLLNLLQERQKAFTGPVAEPAEAKGAPSSGPTEVRPVLPEATAAASEAAITPLTSLLERLHRENVELAGRLGFFQAELEKYKERILLLEAPKVPPRPLNLPREEIPTEPASYPGDQLQVLHTRVDLTDQPTHDDRPWWKRLFGGA